MNLLPSTYTLTPGQVKYICQKGPGCGRFSANSPEQILEGSCKIPQKLGSSKSRLGGRGKIINCEEKPMLPQKPKAHKIFCST